MWEVLRVVLLRNFPFLGRSILTSFREQAMQYVLSGQPAGWALLKTTSRRNLRLLWGEYGQTKRKKLCAIWYSTETIEKELCTVGTTRNYTTGTGNTRAFQLRIAKKSRFAFYRIKSNSNSNKDKPK